MYICIYLYLSLSIYIHTYIDRSRRTCARTAATAAALASAASASRILALATELRKEIKKGIRVEGGGIMGRGVYPQNLGFSHRDAKHKNRESERKGEGHYGGRGVPAESWIWPPSCEV